MRSVSTSKIIHDRIIKSGTTSRIFKSLSSLRREVLSPYSSSKRNSSFGLSKLENLYRNRLFSIQVTRNLTMSDDAYSNFLDKANQDTGASKATQKESPLKTRAVDTEIPAALQSIENYYTSEADEPWEPVSLNYEGSSLGESESCFLCLTPSIG